MVWRGKGTRGRASHRGEAVGDKDEEGRRVGHERAVRRHAVADRNHGWKRGNTKEDEERKKRKEK